MKQAWAWMTLVFSLLFVTRLAMADTPDRGAAQEKNALLASPMSYVGLLEQADPVTLAAVSGHYLVYSEFQPKEYSDLSCRGKDVYRKPLPGKRGAPVTNEGRVAQLPCVVSIDTVGKTVYIHARAIDSDADEFWKITDLDVEQPNLEPAFTSLLSHDSGKAKVRRGFLLDVLQMKKQTTFTRSFPSTTQYHVTGAGLYSLTSPTRSPGSLLLVDDFDAKSSKPRSAQPYFGGVNAMKGSLPVDFQQTASGYMVAWAGSKHRMGGFALLEAPAKAGEPLKVKRVFGTSLGMDSSEWAELPIQSLGIRQPGNIAVLAHGIVGSEHSEAFTWDQPFVFYAPDGETTVYRLPYLSGRKHSVNWIRGFEGGLLVSEGGLVRWYSATNTAFADLNSMEAAQ